MKYPPAVVNPAEINPARESPRRDRAGLLQVRGDAERAGDVVGGPERQDAQRYPTLREPLHRRVEGAVPARDEHSVHLWSAPPYEVGKPGGVPNFLQGKVEAEVPEALGRVAARIPPPAGPWVHQQECPGAGHRRGIYVCGMTTPPTAFRESNLWSTPIRDLGLTIADTRLEPIVAEFEEELRQAGLTRLRPRFYLSTEWGVPFETVAIAIPFYLARPELTALHEEQTGHVEGFNRADMLRYLRHEMGHVVSYAYRLYDDEEWVRRFGSITQPYEEDYRPEPFSRRFVRHLPGWYAQKHPDEDWAETFAVWMTPGFDWHREYESWPEALGKLCYCDKVMRQITARDPLVTTAELDEDVGEIGYSVADYYEDLGLDRSPDFPPGLDGALRAIFEESGGEATQDGRRPAADLLVRLERSLMENVYRWTGHFPERTRLLVRHLAGRARELKLAYHAGDETAAATGLTTFVTALAMNHVHRGTYLP